MTEKIKDAVYTKRYVYNCHYHLIWCTKYRNQIFTTAELASEMKELIIDTAASNDIQIEKLEVMPEHIHAMISFRPSKSISAVVKALKGHTGYVFCETTQTYEKVNAGVAIYGHQAITLGPLAICQRIP